MKQGAGLVLTIVCVVPAVLLLRAALWWSVCAIARFARWLLRHPAGWPAAARATSARAVLKARHPKAYAVLAERFVTTSFTGLPLTLLFLASVYAAALVAGLIDDVRETEGLVRIDLGVNAFFVPYRTPALIGSFIWITALGAGPAVTGMLAVASALLLPQGGTRLLLPLWITFLGAQGTTWASKYAVDRARPAFLDAVTAATPSFPSGHATASTALIGFLAYVTARRLPSVRAKFEVVFWSVAIIGLICFSRIFLSLHYLSDVAAGVLVGVFWILVGVTVSELGRRRSA